MSAPQFDLDGLQPTRRAVEFDLGPRRAGGPEFDLPPIDLKKAWDLDILLQKAPIPTVEYAAWLQALRTAAAEAAKHDAHLDGRLSRMVGVLEAASATICFGGHFKTGKSTLLNAALGRRVLPAADLPETGTICVLRSGQTDAVVVSDGQSRRTIPCTLEAIQKETSLIGEAGERRTQVHRVEQLEITLSGCGIPSGARWLDSPGINDTEEMNACALRAARQADVLVWVLSSKQPLSEVEMVFLADYIAERGPNSVVFLLNAFLQENTPQAWETFLARKAPWIQDKVHHHAPDLGFSEKALPHVAPVCGLGLFGDSANDFGRTELRRLLLGLGSPEVPRIRRARLGRIALDLKALAAECEAQREKQREESVLRRQTKEKARSEAEQKRPQFENALRRRVEAFYTQWAANARSCAGGLMNSITGPTLARGEGYSRQLNAALDSVDTIVAKGLIMECRRLAAEWGQPTSDTADAEKLRKLLTPPFVSVAVANTPSNANAAQTANRVDGAVRSMLQPLGIKLTPALGATLESTLGAHQETPEKRERDAALTRQQVQEATEQAIKTLQNRKEEVCALLLSGSAVSIGRHSGPEVPRLSFQDEMRETLLRLAEQAERLATQDA